MTRTEKWLLAGGFVGILGSSVVAGVATYKAYPKLKEAKDQGLNFIETVNYVWKDYIPAAGTILGTSGLIIASECIGEQDLRKVEEAYYRAERKAKQISNWYKNEHKAIEEKFGKLELPKPDKPKSIYIPAQLVDPMKAGWYDKTTFYDPFFDVKFEATMNDIMLCIDENINQNIITSGYAMAEEFYNEFEVKLPEEFTDYGWSMYTAQAMWVDPWVRANFSSEKDYIVLTYEGNAGCRTTMPFPPSNDPTSEAWI